MSHLLYSSNEMFSSTSLIRQSKQIFDKLNTNEITKAVILRDGKPSFVMLDFDKYETIFLEYEKLKKDNENIKQINMQTIKQTKDEVGVVKNKTTEEDLAKTLNSENGLEIELDDEDKENSLAEIKEFWN